MYTDEKIAKVEGFALSSQYGDGKVFGQPKGKKSIGFIEITSESGVKGFGEAYCGIYSPELMKPIVDFLSSYLVGKSLNNLSFFNEIDMIPFIGYTGIIQGVRIGIELAVMDLIGKITEKPVHELFSVNEKKKEIKCYYSGGSVIFNTDEIKADIENLYNLGFEAFKMRVGYQSWRDDLDRVNTASLLMNKDDLMVDAIMGTLKNKWKLSEASNKIIDLEKFKIRWIEEPLCPTNLIEHKKLKEISKIPIAIGEAYSGNINFDTIISLQAADIVQIDATNSMGYNKLLDFSIKNEVEQATHVWGSSLSFIANAHLSCLSKNIKYLEYPSISFKVSEEILEEKININNGKYILNNYPGFGINITRSVKEKFKYEQNSGYKL